MTRTARLVPAAAAALSLLVPAAAAAEWRLGNGQNPPSVTVAPGSGPVLVDAFTLLDDSFYGTETITAVNVQMSSGSALRLTNVEILNDAGAVLGSVANPVSDALTVTLTTPIVQGYWDYTLTYRIRITPKGHADVPAPPGAEYPVTAVIASVNAGGVRVRGRDLSSATVTIDNASPGAATAASGLEGDGRVDLAWTNPAAADLAGVLVLRRIGSPPAEVPVEGASYAPGTAFGSSTVVSTSLATSLADTGLVNRTTYYYALWARDSRGNYAAAPAAIVGPMVPDIVTIVGEGASEPASASVCPGTGPLGLDAFTLRTTSGTDTVTSVTVDFDDGTAQGVGSVSVVGTVTNGTLANPPDPASIPLGVPIAVDTVADAFTIRITPRTHAAMPAVPGGIYEVEGRVTAVGHTSTTQYVRYYDVQSAAITVDNQSPATPLFNSTVAGDGHVALAWTLPLGGDFAGGLLLRKTSPIGTAPAEGATYALGAVIDGAHVAWTGTGTGLDDAGLVNFQPYYYALYARDLCGNWSLAAMAGPLVPRPSTIVGEGTDPAPVTVCPGTPAADVDGFTLRTSQETDTVSAVQIQLAAGTGGYLSRVSVHDGAGAERGGVAPAGDLVTVPVTPIAVGTTAAPYRIRVTPKAGADLPPPPGGSYAVTARVVGLTQSASHNLEFLDGASGTVTIANTHPRNPSWGAVTPLDGQLRLAWTDSPDGNVDGVVILRSASPVVAWPAEGTTYVRGDVIGASTVAVAGPATPSSAQTFLDGGLTNWTGYHYAAFATDTCGNTSSGAFGGPWIPVPNATTTGALSVSALACSQVEVSAAFTADADGDGSVTIRRGAASSGPFDAIVCTVGGPSPRTCTDGSAPPESPVYYQATFADPDGVSGSNPIVSGGSTPRCAYNLTLSAGTPMAPAATLPAGSAGVEIARVKLSASQETVTLTSLGVRNASASNPALPGIDVLALQFVDVLSGAPVASAHFDGLVWRFRDLELQVLAGLDRTYAVEVALATGAVPGRTFQPRMDAADATVAWPDALVPAIVTGSVFTVGAGPTEGLPAEYTAAPMVLLQNPIDGATVTAPFRVQVQVYSPTANGLSDVSSIQLSQDGGLTWASGLFTLNANFPVGAKAGIYEAVRTPAPGTYAFRVRATNPAGTVESGTSVVVVNDATVRAGDGKLVVRDNSSQLCGDCHAVQTHSSQTASSATTGLSKYGSWSNSCRDCHTPHDTTNLMLVKERISPPSVSAYLEAKDVRFLDRKTGDGADSFVSSANRNGPCQACHTRTSETSDPSQPRWRRDADSGGHYATGETQRCTDCHRHSAGFQAVESSGGEICGGCHSNQWKRMTGEIPVAFRHKMGADLFGDAVELDWDNPLTAVPEEQRSCVNSCHQDHVHNPVGGTEHAWNVHEDASTAAARAVTRDASGLITAGTPAKTDYLYEPQPDGSIRQGACLSCHQNQIDATRPPISATEYENSAHKTTWTQAGANVFLWQYDLHDGSKFDRNCTKCHAGPTESAPSARMTSGVHYSENRHFLTGTLHPAGNPAGFVCYNCHGDGTVGNRYTDKDVYSQAVKTYGHPVNDEAGTHDTLGENFTVWGSGEFSGANRHASCMDCHLPHTAGKTRHDANDAMTPASATRNSIGEGSTLLGATGVDYVNWPGLTRWQLPGQADLVRRAPAVREYQICFKCHTSWAWGASAPPVAQPSLGGSGEQMTDVAQDFNPMNSGGHPVVTGLANYPGSLAPRALDPAQLLAPWATNVGTQTMYCSDCHGADAESPAVQGPHGSAAKFVLKGPNTRWPYDASGALFTKGTGVAGSGLFCLNCHPPPGNTGNAAHGVGKHVTTLRCVSCHVVIPHGSKTSRLTVTASAPQRYRLAPVGAQLLGFKKGATRANYSKANAATDCGGANPHTTSTVGYETW